MSRVGRKPIPIPGGTKVEIAGDRVKVNGPKGQLDWTLPRPITAVVEGSQVVVRRPDDAGRHRALHGLSREIGRAHV